MAVALHPRTQATLEAYLKRPRHGLLLTGEAGVGKSLVAAWLAEELAGKAHVLTIKPSATYTISIEDIHTLQRHARHHQVGAQRRVFIIEQADAMTVEAQNAFLKQLEEPAEGNFFILTTRRAQSLLPTITSRAQEVQILPLDLEGLKAAFPAAPPAELDKHYRMFGGRAGLIAATLSDNTHPLLQDIALVKRLLAADAFGRLKLADELTADRGRALAVCEALQLVLQRLLEAAAGRNEREATRTLSQKLEAALAAQRHLMANGQLKLAVDNLLLQL